MDWKNLATLLAVFVTMWWQLDRKIKYEISTLDHKIDQLNSLLTNNLIALNRDMGELQGASHSHPSAD